MNVSPGGPSTEKIFVADPRQASDDAAIAVSAVRRSDDRRSDGREWKRTKSAHLRHTRVVPDRRWRSMIDQLR